MSFKISKGDWDKVINYSQYAWDSEKSEIGGYMIVQRDMKTGDFVMSDPVILEQVITAGNTVIDKDALAKYLMKTAMKHGTDIYYCWWHSHHTMNAFWSGTDLNAIKAALCDPEYVNIFFSANRISPIQMNGMYNLADVTMLISSNEGWGLSLTESMMSGTMIIPNVTGGMQDQARFVDDKGEWFTPSADIPSNHRKTYTEHGEWAVPVFPNNI